MGQESIISSATVFEANKINTVIVLASYMELQAIETLLSELLLMASEDCAVIVADDSGPAHQERLVGVITSLSSNAVPICLSASSTKSGRGAAIRRGVRLGLDLFPNASRFVECDSDGSHRAVDILMMAQKSRTADVLIGSRYLAESQIIGWPAHRRAFSRILNYAIPRLIHVPSSDLTNGLRSYARAAASEISVAQQLTSGFIYLSESAAKLAIGGFSFADLPIVFVERTSGKSTVGVREIFDSLNGLVKIKLHLLRSR